MGNVRFEEEVCAKISPNSFPFTPWDSGMPVQKHPLRGLDLSHGLHSHQHVGAAQQGLQSNASIPWVAGINGAPTPSFCRLDA